MRLVIANLTKLMFNSSDTGQKGLFMSIVLVGGNDRMAGRYRDICKDYSCKAKVFIKMPADFERKIGNPDLVIVFTGTCSHKMLSSVNQKADKNKFPVAHIHSASVNALKTVLDEWVAKKTA